MIWTSLDADQKEGLNIALNEATLLGVEVNREKRSAGATFSVLTLPPEGPPPDDRRVLLLFQPVGRLAASLRLGDWNDPKAEVVPLEVDQLLETVAGFKCSVYGRNFFDCDEDFEDWKDRLSLDIRLGDDGLSHSITLFQEGHDRHLDIRIWFDSLTLRAPSGEGFEMGEFIAGGKRWWDGLHSGDPRTQGEGIVPMNRDNNS